MSRKYAGASSTVQINFFIWSMTSLHCFFFLHIVQHLYDMFPYKQMGNKSDTTLGQQHLNSTSEKHILKCKHSRWHLSITTKHNTNPSIFTTDIL